MNRPSNTARHNSEATLGSTSRDALTCRPLGSCSSRVRRAVFALAALSSLASACGGDSDHPQGDLEPPLRDGAVDDGDAQGFSRDGSLEGSTRDASEAAPSNDAQADDRGEASIEASTSAAIDAREDRPGDPNGDGATPSDGAPRLDGAMSADITISPDAPASSDGATNDRFIGVDSGLATDATAPGDELDISADDAATGPNEAGACGRVGEACGALSTCCAGSACTDDEDPHCAATCTVDSQCQSSVPGCCKPVGTSNVRVCVDYRLCAP